ncbi:MAG: tyrosine-type recombinase/integrase [Dehalococcoidia bacterium]
MKALDEAFVRTLPLELTALDLVEPTDSRSSTVDDPKSLGIEGVAEDLSGSFNDLKVATGGLRIPTCYVSGSERSCGPGGRMPNIDELIATYITACELEGKSKNTIRSYRESLRKFRERGTRLGLPDEIDAYTVPLVYTYLGALRADGAADTYQHRMHREVKTFFSWCRRMNIIDENPFARVPLVKLEQKIVQPFNADQIRALLAATEHDPYPGLGLRDRAIVLFLLDTGVRASECTATNLEDVDWERGRVRILHGKGKKQRWVGLGEQAQAALRTYIEQSRGDQPGALFLSQTRRRMFSNALNHLLKRLARRAGVEGVHPHRFRHTFATWAIRSMAREVDVQSLLGHSSLTMVQRYSRTYSSEQAVQAHVHFSPVAQLELA